MRPATGRDEDMFCGVALTPDRDRVGIDEDRAVFEYFAAGAVQQTQVHPVQTRDFDILVGNEFGPLESGRRGVPAIAFRDRLGVWKLRAVNEEFLRNAADIDTGAAKVAFFGDADAGAQVPSDARRAHATRAGADHKEIKIVTRRHSASFE